MNILCERMVRRMCFTPAPIIRMDTVFLSALGLGFDLFRVSNFTCQPLQLDYLTPFRPFGNMQRQQGVGAPLLAKTTRLSFLIPLPLPFLSLSLFYSLVSFFHSLPQLQPSGTTLFR